MRPSTQGEFEAYIESEAGARWLACPEFEKRCVDLFQQLEADTMTLAEAAKFVRLPVNVFRHCFAYYLAHQAQQMGTPPTGAIN